MVIAVILIALFYALPNVFDQNPSIQIAAKKGQVVDQKTKENLTNILKEAKLPFKDIVLKEDKMWVKFADTDSQFKAQNILESKIGNEYRTALTTVAEIPDWITKAGGKTMKLGLDLKGGVHVVIDVKIEEALAKKLKSLKDDLRSLKRKAKIRSKGRPIIRDGQVIIAFETEQAREKMLDAIADDSRFTNLKREASENNGLFYAKLSFSPYQLNEIKSFAITQNITTLRNRVNSLGVTEPIIQRQGERHIVVQVPGAQDPTGIKKILNATATLEYRAGDTEHNARQAEATGRIPVGYKLYHERGTGQPILLKRKIIVTGDQITNASSGLDARNGTPMVSVRLDAAGAKRMLDFTTENVGKPMGVVFIEDQIINKIVDGQVTKVKKHLEEVISLANIREPFGPQFQTTGLDSVQEAHELALLLKAGALAAPIEIVEERTIGPSLGQESINQGFISVVIGFLLVVCFMAYYYRAFGMVANAALFANLLLMIAILSLLQATLTLPGIAGIVLTVGMAVDANVLIFERIREELRNGNSPQNSINAGYSKAFSTIIDANITTLIAAIVLFSFGTGAIKGFAVTLFIGIVTSMFTAIIGTRAIINWIYGGKNIKQLSIGGVK